MEQVLSPEISLLREGDTLTLRLTGVVGIMAAAELRQGALELAQHAGPVVVDATAAEHLDCSAAQLLLALSTALTQDGGKAPAVVPSACARRYLELAGLAAPLGLS